MKIQHKEDYRLLRARKYPNLGNQLDAIYKLTVSLKEQGIQLPAETEAWINQCLLVKSTYKKDL